MHLVGLICKIIQGCTVNRTQPLHKLYWGAVKGILLTLSCFFYSVLEIRCLKPFLWSILCPEWHKMMEMASILGFLSGLAYVSEKNKSLMIQDMFVFETLVYVMRFHFKCFIHFGCSNRNIPCSFWYISNEMQLYTVYLFLENCSTCFG